MDNKLDGAHVDPKFMSGWSFVLFSILTLLTHDLFTEDQQMQFVQKKSELEFQDQQSKRNEFEKDLNNYLKQHKYQMTEESKVPWDGNCYYNAASFFLSRQDVNLNARQIRNDTMELLQNNIDRYISEYALDPDASKELQQMEKKTAYLFSTLAMIMLQRKSTLEESL